MKIPRQWTFQDSGVASNFDAHVREQLPWYTLATEAVVMMADNYLPKDGLVYDVGASTGNIGLAMAPLLKARSARLIAVEESPQMAALYRGPGKLLTQSAQATKWEPFDVAVLFLTLMFVPVADRAALLTGLLSAVRPGGAVIIVDKEVPPDGYVGTVLRRLTMSWKLKNGAKPDAVVRKDLSLAGIQRPLTVRDLPAGAVRVLQFGEFAAWIVEACGSHEVRHTDFGRDGGPSAGCRGAA